MGTNATKKAASKIIAVLLAALMLVSVMPMTAFAAKDSTIEVEGLTVYGWEESDLDYIDLDDDSKEAKTWDAFSFDGLTIEVTYRSLADIKNNGDVKDLDVSVEIELVDGNPWGYKNYVQKVVFGNNGRLPGDPQVRIPVEYYFWKAGLDEVYFDMLYVDGNDLEDVEEDIPIKGDAFVEVTMKHNSTYLLVPASDVPETGDSMLWLAAGAAAAATFAAALTVYKKKKAFLTK